MDDEAHRPRLDRAGASGGTVIVPPDWRKRLRRGKSAAPGVGAGEHEDEGSGRGAAEAPGRADLGADDGRDGAGPDHAGSDGAELGEPDAAVDPRPAEDGPDPRHHLGWSGWSTLESLRRDAAATFREAPTPRELWQRRPTATELRTHATTHRYLIAALLVVVTLAAADAAGNGAVTDRTLAPGEAQRVALPYPPQVQTSTPSVRRLIDAVATGERLREQAVVAEAARATLERARAEAAAAAAGQPVPWLTTGVAPVPGSTPGSVIPGPGGFVLPARGVFTSGFGSRWGTMHQGIDIAGPIGSPIYAVAAGTVVDAGPAQGFGLWVRIRHDDGTITVYGHMYDFFVSVGERVPAGMQIARIGNRGDSSGPHLHFEVIEAGQHVDPQRWLALRGLSLG